MGDAVDVKNLAPFVKAVLPKFVKPEGEGEGVKADSDEDLFSFEGEGDGEGAQGRVHILCLRE